MMGAIEEPGLEILGKRKNAGSQDKWTTESVLSIRWWTPTLVSLRTSRHRGFRFTPGHYTRLGLGAAGDIVWRPFSLASAAYDDFLEFIAVLVPGGAFSEPLKQLRVRRNAKDCMQCHVQPSSDGCSRHALPIQV